MATSRQVFGATYEELVAMKIAWDRQHKANEDAINDPVNRAMRATRTDMEKNREKYLLNTPIRGPGPITKVAIAGRIAQQNVDNENLTLEEVSIMLAKAFNAVAIDPGSASMKNAKEQKQVVVEQENVDIDMADLDEDEDMIDEETNQHCLNVIKVGRRENKPTYMGPTSVPSRKISLKSSTPTPSASTRVDNPFDMTLDEYVQQTKEATLSRMTPQRDRSTMNMSLNDIIKSANATKAQKAAGAAAARRRDRKPRPSKFKRYVSYARKEKLGTIEEVPETAAERMKIRRICQRSRNQGQGANEGKCPSGKKFSLPANMDMEKWVRTQDHIDMTIKTKEGFLSRDRQRTPESVLHEMTENGFDVEYEAMEMQEDLAASEEEFRAKRWRVVYTVHDVYGIGVAPRKEFATQLAAFDVLRQIKERIPDLQLQFCQIPLADRVNPMVMHNLAKECHLRKIPLRYNHHTELEDNVISHARFIGIYTCGDRPFYGYSLRGPDDAKKMAAVAAYEGVTGARFPFDPLLFGEACGDGERYNDMWSEAHHVYEASDPIDIKGFTKTNLFGADPSAVEVGIREAARKLPPDVQLIKERADYLEGEGVAFTINVEKDMESDEIVEAFYLDPLSNERNPVPGYETIEHRAIKLGEQMAEHKKRVLEQDLLELAEDADDEVEELDPRLRDRRDWR